MYKRILVPLDGSDYSERVLPYARSMAQRTGTPLEVFRVVSASEDVPSADEYLQELASANSGVRLPAFVERDVATAITKEAKGSSPALIVMTSHGRSGILGSLLGSVAQSVLQLSGGPVVLFHPARRSSGEHADVRELILPLDGSELAEQMKSSAGQMGAWLDTPVTVVQVISPKISSELPSSDVLESGYVESRAAEIAERYDIATDWEVLHGDPAGAICDFVRSRPPAMLCMSSHGRTGLRQTVFGSVTAECLRESGVPVLISNVSA